MAARFSKATEHSSRCSRVELTVRLLSFVLLFFLQACSHYRQSIELSNEQPKVDSVKFTIEQLKVGNAKANARGKILLVHGLNNTPDVLDDAAAFFQEQGFQTFALSLSGHLRDSRENLGMDFAATWINDIEQAHQIAKSTNPELPLHGFGYSLGGLLLVHRAIVDPSMKSIVLVAPSIGLRGRTTLLETASRFGPSGLRVPSAAPRSIRRRGYTTLAAYRGLFDLHDAIQDLPANHSLNEIRGSVLIHRQDETINPKRLEEWQPLPRHLLIAPAFVAPAIWDDMMREAIETFSAD
jgi:esterase/lipase